MIVTKCCFCCSLKYGFLTYGTISLILRFATAIALVYNANLVFYSTETAASSRVAAAMASVVGSIIGWMFGSCIALYIALKGIATRRSILIYPYIVVLAVEILLFIISALILTIMTSPLFLVELVVVGGINIYIGLCLISLYQSTKEKEKNQSFAHIPLKNI